MLSGCIGGAGFDLILGNPPWVGAGFSEASIAADFDPTLGIRKAKSAEISKKLLGLTVDFERRKQFLEILTISSGMAASLSGAKLHPELGGARTNLYKNFILCSIICTK